MASHVDYEGGERIGHLGPTTLCAKGELNAIERLILSTQRSVGECHKES